MLKKIITKTNKPLILGRGVEQGKIMLTLNDFGFNSEGKYRISTTSYLIKEDAENPVPDGYVYQVQGFDYYKIKVIDSKVTSYDANVIQQLFVGINKEILLTGDFTVQLSDILNNALLMVVASENTFNIGGPEEWELID